MLKRGAAVQPVIEQLRELPSAVMFSVSVITVDRLRCFSSLSFAALVHAQLSELCTAAPFSPPSAVLLQICSCARIPVLLTGLSFSCGTHVLVNRGAHGPLIIVLTAV